MFSVDATKAGALYLGVNDTVAALSRVKGQLEVSFLSHCSFGGEHHRNSSLVIGEALEDWARELPEPPHRSQELVLP